MRLLLSAVAIAAVLAGLAPEGYALSPEYQLDADLSSTESTIAYDITQNEGFTPPFEHVELGLSSASLPSLDFDPLNEKVSIALPATPLLVDAMGNLDLQVPMVRTAKIDRHVHFFSYQIRDRFEQWLSRLERYRPSVQSIFSEFKLPLDLIFLSLVESGFNTNAVSRAKAVGPWQFMKPTAKFYGLRVDSWVDERRDPVKSTVAAAQYLRDLYHLFGSWPLAMAAYNAGEGKVGRSMARLKDKDSDFWALVDTKLLRAETREYVPRFVAAAQIAKDPARFGFNIAPQPPVEFEEVIITRPVHLKAAARAAGVSLEEMKNLNPELRREMTPPDPLYVLKVPVGKKSTMMANLPVYRTLYPAVYLEPKRKLFAGAGKEKLGLSHLAARARQHKSPDWLKGKSGRSKSPVLAQAK
jgi:hypothetical protein